MFGELENILHFNSSSPPNGKTILITERGADGSFLLHHLVATYLKGGHYVCLVGLAQTFTHYSCIAGKFSLNLKAARDAGQLIFLDALKLIGSGILERSSFVFPPDATETQKRQTLGGFYEAVKNSINELSDWKNKPTLLVIDELSILVLLGYSSFNVSVFAHYLQLLVCPSENSLGAFATVIHTDATASDEEIESLQKQVAHRCQQLVYVDRLKTGYCRDISGEISVVNRNLSTGIRDLERHHMHFKLTEKALTLHPFGMSAAVL